MTRYRIRNWSRYQHYKHRNPPWIKLHVETLASEDWVTLADASKLLMVVCMVLAARENGVISGNADYIKRVAYLDKLPDLTPLIECGFLEKVLADASGCKRARTNAEPETETEADTEKKESPLNPPKGESRKRSAKQTPEPDGFSELWILWPRKEGKQEATAALRKALKRATIEEIMAGARRYMAHVAGKETEFIKTLGPWLNKSRWEDELTSKTPETNGADHDREGELRVRRQLYLAGKIPWNEADGPAPEPPFDPVADLPEYLRRGGTA